MTQVRSVSAYSLSIAADHREASEDSQRSRSIFIDGPRFIRCKGHVCVPRDDHELQSAITRDALASTPRSGNVAVDDKLVLAGQSGFCSPAGGEVKTVGFAGRPTGELAVWSAYYAAPAWRPIVHLNANAWCANKRRRLIRRLRTLAISCISYDVESGLPGSLGLPPTPPSAAGATRKPLDSR